MGVLFGLNAFPGPRGEISDGGMSAGKHASEKHKIQATPSQQSHPILADSPQNIRQPLPAQGLTRRYDNILACQDRTRGLVGFYSVFFFAHKLVDHQLLF